MAAGIIAPAGTVVTTTTTTYDNLSNPSPGGFAHLPQAQALRIIVNVTAVTGTSPTLTVAIKGKTYQGFTYPILSTATINATGTYVLTLSAGATASAGTSPVGNGVAPSTYQVVLTTGGTTPSFTLGIDVDQSGN